MTALLTLIITGVFLWLLCDCNHEDEIIEHDDEYDCHKVKCLHCGRETRHDPYAGIEG